MSTVPDTTAYRAVHRALRTAPAASPPVRGRSVAVTVAASPPS